MVPGGISTQLIMPPLTGTVSYKDLQPSISSKETGSKIKTIVISTLAFTILSHIAAYRIAESFYKAFTNIQYAVIAEDGNTTLKGAFIMSCLFFATMIYII